VRLAGLLLAMLIGGAGAWHVQNWRYEGRLAELASAQAQAIASAERLARTEEQRRQAVVEKVQSDAREQIKAAKADAGHADTAGQRLHIAAGVVARSGDGACGSGAAQRGASATRAAMVLSDLFQRADKRAGELAAAYDRARVAGLACERSYDGIIGK